MSISDVKTEPKLEYGFIINEESADARFVFLDEYVYFGNLADVEELTEVGVVHAIDQLLLPE